MSTDLKKWAYITAGERVLSNQPGCTMDKSDHDEAENRISLHVHNILRKGGTSILVRTLDTDIIVILVGIFYSLVN